MLNAPSLVCFKIDHIYITDVLPVINLFNLYPIVFYLNSVPFLIETLI